MVLDFAWAAGEVISIVGLLCGAYVSITYVDHDRLSLPECAPADTGAGYDPITMHHWSVTSRSLENRVHQAQRSFSNDRNATVTESYLNGSLLASGRSAAASN